ncbi:MAG: M50 family metallopeptidase [Eubacteriales bacterium]
MINVATILFSILALSILVVAHELGHFLAGKWLGFDIYEFAIGFGPKIFSKEKKGTKFSLRALPLGGFVAFDDEKNLESGELSFDKKPVWKRIVVVLAGPFMNVVAALLIIISLYTVSGIVRYDEPTQYYITSMEEGGPAYEAGMEAGDIFYMMEDKLVAGDYDVLTSALQDEDGLNVTVLRDGEQVEMYLVPEYSQADQRYMIDIELGQQYMREKVSFGSAMKEGTAEVFNMTKELVVFMGKLFFRGEGAKDVGSIVGAVDVMSTIVRQLDFYVFIYILAFISINLGLFNLIPFPPFDGFKVGMYLFEKVRGKKISIETQSKWSMAGFIILFALSAFLMYRDFARIFTGG